MCIRDSLEGSTGAFTGRAQFKDVIDDLEDMSFKLRQQLFPAMLGFLYKSKQDRDVKKFAKHSTPASQIKEGNIVLCRKDYLQSHEVSTSLLRVKIKKAVRSIA